jgi:hypothetical protein
MEQRPLRLGDIVDDYCPRERRITNHAIVAAVGEVIKQTRCTTCDSEHVYKEARIPKRRKAAPTAFDQVLADVTGGHRTPPPAADPPPAVEAGEAGEAAVPAPETEPGRGSTASVPAPRTSAPAASAAAAEEPDETAGRDEPADAWVSNRRLIRATLPKVEGDEPPPRPIPEFTMHQWQARGAGGSRGRQPWRGNGSHGQGQGHGHGHGAPGNVDGNRPQGARHGRPPVDGNPTSPGGGPGRKSGRRRRRNKRPRPQ